MIQFHPNGSTEEFHRRDSVQNVVNLLLGDGKLFIKDIALIINTSYSLDDFEELFCGIYQTYIDIFEINKDLNTAFYNLWGNLRNIYNDEPHSGNLRGAIVEFYVYSVIDRKYHNKDDFNIDCTIQVDDWYSERTVDVAIINLRENLGECCECKVDAHGLDADDIENLNDIFYNSNNILKPKIVSFSARKAILNWIQVITHSYSQIEIYGRDNLHQFIN
jgi:hypothetical protein